MNWSVAEFQSLFAAPSRNGIYKSKEHHGTGAKVINMGELFAYDRIGIQNMSRVQMTELELVKDGINSGDLLFGRRSLVEEGAGRCALAWDIEEPTTFESSIIRVRLNPELADPAFYFYYFRSPAGRGLIRSIVSGATVKGIRGSDLQRLKVVHPPLCTQAEISKRLFYFDDLIETNRRRIALLEEAARLLYREWFVNLRFPGYEQSKMVDGLPEGWAKVPLDDLAFIVMGQSPESQFYNRDGEGFPFHQGVTDFGEHFVSHKTYTTQTTRIAEAGDILCSVRAPVGRLNMTSDQIAIGRGLSAMRSRTGQQALLLYQLKALFVEEDMIGGGAIFASVGKKELYAQQLLQPDIETATEFDRQAGEIIAQLETLEKQNRLLAQARDELLPKLMSGEIQP